MTESVTDEPIGHDDQGLRDISAEQWKSGLAAWLGWLFDGLDMHLYTLVAAPFVAALLDLSDPSDPRVRVVQLVDPGGVPARLGAGGRAVRPDRRSIGAEPGVCVDDPDLRPVHRPVIDRADLVALADLPVPGGAGDRRRVGGGGLAALGDLAPALAALDRRGAPVGGERGHPAGLGRRLPDGRREPPAGLPGRRAAGLAGALDPPRGP